MLKNLLSLGIVLLAGFVLSACASRDGDDAFAGTSRDLTPTTDSAPLANLMASERYADALELALQDKLFGVANYLAEYVLETDELLAFVEKKYPNAPVASVPEETADGAIIESLDDVANEVRYTLARRLLREGQPARSRDFFPKELLPVFDSYTEAIRRGYNFDLPDTDRARGFWDAATIVRENGDALFSVFSVPVYIKEKEFYTDEERARVESRDASEPIITVRLRAANLARYAASLLPNNDERTARVLFAAGVWLRSRDVKSADDFYKSLVIRCPKTAVGKRCAELRWFPAEIPWTRAQIWDGVPAESGEAVPEDVPAESGE